MLNPMDIYQSNIITPSSAQTQKEMAVTFNIIDNYGYVYIPIGRYGTVKNQNVRIDWGDGQTTEIEAGISIPKNATSHKYSSNAGYKTAIITSETGIIPSWETRSTDYYYVGTKTYISNFTDALVRYETPLLKVEDPTSVSIGGGTKLEYIDPYLLKNNSHITFFDAELVNYEKSSGETYKGDTYKLTRNILLDLPNLQYISAWTGLICGEQAYDKDTLFENCQNLETVDIDVNFFRGFYFPDKRFPNIFKNNPKLIRAGCGSINANTYANSTTDSWMLDQIHTIPEDMFRNCPKLQHISGLFSGQCQNLQTAGISFTKGGFFAENWAPEGQVRVDSMFAINGSNSINTGNATEFVNTIKEASNNNYWAKGCFYGHNSMEGYSTIDSTFRTSPY